MRRGYFKNEALDNFRGSAKKGDRSVGGSLSGGLIGFKEGDDFANFP